MKQLFFLAIIVLVGCTSNQQENRTTIPAISSPTPMPSITNPYVSLPSDSKLEKGPAFVDEAGVFALEGPTRQFQLHLSGTLPDPCHELRIEIGQPDIAMNIKVDAYSVVDPTMMCIQVIKPFSAKIDLGSFPAGHYTVIINDEIMAEFDA